MDKTKEAIEANIAVHTAMASEYNTVEPHFRPESIARVKSVIDGISHDNPLKTCLDLGCGTGFMIDILKTYASSIVGVDVTQAMLDRVDSSGNAQIELINADTGSVEVDSEFFDLVTAYTFLDHLYDMRPTIANAYRALKPNGSFYADLSPNFYFWEQIKTLKQDRKYDPIVQREINAVLAKDAEIQEQFGVDKETFKMAEHQKHIKGGLVEEELETMLKEAGFKNVQFIYHWYIGQAQLINDESLDRDFRFSVAETMHNYLEKSLPLSRHLFKYIGFIATK